MSNRPEREVIVLFFLFHFCSLFFCISSSSTCASLTSPLTPPPSSPLSVLLPAHLSALYFFLPNYCTLYSPKFTIQFYLNLLTKVIPWYFRDGTIACYILWGALSIPTTRSLLIYLFLKRTWNEENPICSLSSARQIRTFRFWLITSVLFIASWIRLNQCSPLDNCEKAFLGTVKCFKFPKIQLLICNDILAPNLLLSVYC